MPAERPDLTIILPRHREGPEVVLGTVARLEALRRELSLEIIVVDDSGGRGELDYLCAEHPRVRVIANARNQGKGFSVSRGVEHALGRYIFYSDIDLPVDLDGLPRAVGLLDTLPGVSMIIGARVLTNPCGTTSNALRRLTSRAYLRLFNLLLEPGVQDSQCPYKIIEAAAAKCIFRVAFVRGYAFDAELIHLARRMGLRVDQVRVPWRDTRAPWSPVKTLLVFVRMTWDLVSIRLHWMIYRERLAGGSVSVAPSRQGRTAFPLNQETQNERRSVG